MAQRCTFVSFMCFMAACTALLTAIEPRFCCILHYRIWRLLTENSSWSVDIRCLGHPWRRYHDDISFQ